MKRGEIRWCRFRLPDKRRPVLVLMRDDVIDHLNEIIVVPATRTIRGLTTEVVLTTEDGMPAACALNFDHLALAQRDQIGPILCGLAGRRWVEVRLALLIACGFGGKKGGDTAYLVSSNPQTRARSRPRLGAMRPSGLKNTTALPVLMRESAQKPGRFSHENQGSQPLPRSPSKRHRIRSRYDQALYPQKYLA